MFKTLRTWCVDAMASGLRVLLEFLLVVLALVGLFTTVNFALDLNANHCAQINDRVGVCLVSNKIPQ